MSLRVTADLLVKATNCRKVVAEQFADHIDAACRKYGIATKEQVAGFLAQMAHESRWFTRLEEDLDYRSPERLVQVWPSRFRMPSREEANSEAFTDGKRNPMMYISRPYKLAEYVYGGRMGNGPEGSGDGYKYRGRGLKQLTGRYNYTLYQTAEGAKVVDEPDLLKQPHYAADSAGWYWTRIKGNVLVADFDRLTLAINGGNEGASERRSLYQRALYMLS